MTTESACDGAVFGPRPIREIEHIWIPLQDGTRLSARIWLPLDAETDPVPAILEYLPYRKDDATAAGDAKRHPYFAAHGYAAVRVDLRGTGDSDGLCLDEYLKQEQDDALEVLEWIASQPWCTGATAMFGYSWGGFNGLQVAARRPPSLKAIVTMYSTDDRYTDDCHYQGGCLLAPDMLKWAAWMHALNARPPDPRIVGDAWREQWLDRLRDTPPYIEAWMEHQRRDAFWKHGSVDEEYGAIEAAVLAVGGWADPYTNAVPRLLEHLSAPRAGIIGPWGHVVPAWGVPGPAIGFLQECVAWFDRWLKGLGNGADGAPLLRAWIQDSVVPTGYLAQRPGRWIGEREWPPASVRDDARTLTSDGALVSHAPHREPTTIDLLGDQLCGATVGAWCPNGFPDELPLDQRPDDALSLCFDSAPLPGDLEVLGRPVARLTLAADRPCALVVARLCDVAPDGTSLLITLGLLNLTHRDGDESPEPLEPGRSYDVEIALNVIGQRVPAGHRLRLAISPTWWPQAWPSPEPVTLSVAVDGPSSLTVPVRSAAREDEDRPRFGPPESSGPLSGEIVTSGDRKRVTHRDPDTGVLAVEETQTSLDTISATATTYAETAVDRWSIAPGDPLSARVECDREIRIERDGWDIRVVTTAVQTCDAVAFHTESTLHAYHAGELVHSDRRRSSSPRDLV
ncbi:MAG: CocE/NonD family hydrolase [Coriobacteriia bacterium]|nr:CocE/NonD family hydrolase [Coriobacteriia bacterium]